MPLQLLGTIASSVQKISGAFESIATATGTGSSNTITFSSIPSTYQHLQIRINAIVDSAGSVWRIRFNNDSSSSYISHFLYGNGSTAAASSNATTYISNFGYESGMGTITTYPNVEITDILDYSNTSKNKTVRMFSGDDKNASGSGIGMSSGLWINTAAINRIDLILSGGNFTTATTVALYGIKGA